MRSRAPTTESKLRNVFLVTAKATSFYRDGAAYIAQTADILQVI